MVVRIRRSARLLYIASALGALTVALDRRSRRRDVRAGVSAPTRDRLRAGVALFHSSAARATAATRSRPRSVLMSGWIKGTPPRRSDSASIAGRTWGRLECSWNHAGMGSPAHKVSEYDYPDRSRSLGIRRSVVSMTFRLLGAVEVTVDGRPVGLGGRRQRAVLAVLLLHLNQVVGADRLVEEAWDGRPPPGAPGTLQTYISRLRRVIGRTPAQIETHVGGYSGSRWRPMSLTSCASAAPPRGSECASGLRLRAGTRVAGGRAPPMAR